MTPSIEEQVKVLRSVGVSDSEISKTLGVNLKEIDKPVEKPKEEPKSTAKIPLNAYTKEEFEEAKRFSAEGRTNIAIAMAQNRSAGFIGKVLQCETYDDLLEMRKRDVERKREHNENKAQETMTNLNVFAEISKQLTRIADALEATPKKRRFFKR